MSMPKPLGSIPTRTRNPQLSATGGEPISNETGTPLLTTAHAAS